jgi:hypothetical protein
MKNEVRLLIIDTAAGRKLLITTIWMAMFLMMMMCLPSLGYSTWYRTAYRTVPYDLLGFLVVHSSFVSTGSTSI